eukprot:1114460_1
MASNHNYINHSGNSFDPQYIKRLKAMTDKATVDAEKAICEIDAVLASVEQMNPVMQDDNIHATHCTIPDMLAKELECSKDKLNHKRQEHRVIAAKQVKQEASIVHLQYKIIQSNATISDLTKILHERRIELKQKRNAYRRLQIDYNALQERAEVPEDERLVFETQETTDNENSEEEVEEKQEMLNDDQYETQQELRCQEVVISMNSEEEVEEKQEMLNDDQYETQQELRCQEVVISM